jgi:hypothetical protein
MNTIGLQAQCYYRLDRWDDVLVTETRWRGLEQRYPRERVGETCFFVALSAGVHALRGNRQRADDYAQESFEYMVSMSGTPERLQRNQFYCMSVPLLAKGEFARVKFNLEAALDKSGQPVRRGTMAHDHQVYMLLTEAATQQRDAAALALYAPRLAALAERDGHHLYQGIAARAEGVGRRLAGDFRGAAVHLDRAADLFTAQGTRWQVGRTLCERAELARAEHDHLGAQALLTQALAVFEDLKALPDLERTRAALAELGNAAIP